MTTPLPLIYAGIHQPSMAGRIPRCLVSVNRLLHRRSDFGPNDWILDSGAFSHIIRQQDTSHSGSTPGRSNAGAAAATSRPPSPRTGCANPRSWESPA